MTELASQTKRALTRPLDARSADRRSGVVRPQVLAKRHAPRDSRLRRLLAMADVSGIVVGLAVGLLVVSHNPEQFLWGLATLPIWIVIFKTYGLYDRDIKRISHGTVDDLPWVFHGLLVGSLLLFAYFHFVPPKGNIDMTDLAVFGVVSIVAVGVCRSMARRFSVRLNQPERVLLIGEGKAIESLAQKMTAHAEYGVKPVGLITQSASRSQEHVAPILGELDGVELERVVSDHEIERIVVTSEAANHPTLLELLHDSRELGVKIGILPVLFDALGPSVEVDDVEGIAVLGVNPPVLTRSSALLKRAMDIAAASTLLLLASPILVAAAVAVKLDSRGPVFFRQERVGRGGRRFRLAKLRTMVVDAEEQHDALLVSSKDPGWLHLDHDPRITRVGQALRRSSLDELPQLWNVLKGEMSLVGPRPLVESEDRQLEGWRRSRIDLTPGITGLWQVLGRTSIPFEEMIKLDYLYVTNWSLWTDIRLILRTLPVVLRRSGAN